ncbi:SurA N-terminal domain-containing protein, partial [Candidatus Riesia pediculischaeffi]|uniref:SurA N-terminal domain-containing protein n=1 Tax=Candidatus Riesia pediculischaeffi TaxID=428411 RepID=UPI0005849ADD
MNKIISSLIILSLLFTGISSYFFNSDYFDKYVIKVNEELIYKDQFKKAVQREKYLLSKDMNQEFSWNKYDKDLEALIREQVLNKLIQEILLYQYSKKLGIKIGEDQIMEEILHFPIFQKNGIFDREKYKDFLSKNNILGKDFSKEIEKNLFIKKIIQAYLFDEFCLPSESFEYAKFLFQKRRIQILTLPILKYQKLQNVQEEEMKNYYRNHQEQFLFPKMAKVRYIKLDVNDRIDLDLKEEEIFDFYQNNREMFVLPERNYYSMIQTDSMKDAELILDKLNLGHSFQDLAKDFSTHVLSSKKDGSIGWIDKKSLSKTIIPANLIRVGQISKIIRFEEKYLIFRLDRSSEKYYKTFSESRSEIKDIISKDKSSKIFSEIKRSLLEVADKNDTTLLSNIQKKFHISAHQTDWFEFRSLPRQINFKKIEKFIFSNEIQPISVKNDRNKI